MGTPDFAAVILQRLLQRPDLVTIAAVVTQPDRRAGRGRRLEQPPVKVAAARGRRRGDPAGERPPARGLRHGSGVRRRTCCWWRRMARFLPPAVLAIPPRGALNVHASLLPLHRGASPVSAALLASDTVTGVSLMLMNEAMDAGPGPSDGHRADCARRYHRDADGPVVRVGRHPTPRCSPTVACRRSDTTARRTAAKRPTAAPCGATMAGCSGTRRPRTWPVRCGP